MNRVYEHPPSKCSLKTRVWTTLDSSNIKRGRALAHRENHMMLPQDWPIDGKITTHLDLKKRFRHQSYMSTTTLKLFLQETKLKAFINTASVSPCFVRDFPNTFSCDPVSAFQELFPAPPFL